MLLWGRVMGGGLLLFAAVFAGVALLGPPDARAAALGAAAISAAAGLFGAPALVRLFSSFTGDERVLAEGAPGRATILALEPTGWRYNRQLPIVRFALRVETPLVLERVELRQAVSPDLLARLAPGAKLGVRVAGGSPPRVVIDWREHVEGP